MKSIAIQSGEQTIAPIDALWALIQAQGKSVRIALAKRLNASIAEEKKAKVKMTEKEFYEKLEKSAASTASGPIYTMGENETGEQFINRLLSSAK